MSPRTEDPELMEGRDDSVATAIAAGELIERHRSTARRAPDFLHAKPYVILRDKEGAESIHYVDEQMLHPTFRKGVVALADAPSFIEYFTRHANEDSAIYATLDPAQFVAVLDEHPTDDEPEWRDFRATFKPSLSKEWQLWIGHNGVHNAFKSTEEFAYFIEDNAPDFVTPEAAAMMDTALNFRVSQSVKYQAVQRLQDGNVELQYVNLVEGQSSGSTGKVKIPETFTIAIPIFAGPGAPTRNVEARLRYRIQGGQAVLWYDLIRPHKVLQQAFEDLYVEVSDGTGRTLLLGTTD